jgi:hypothetical protein
VIKTLKPTKEEIINHELFPTEEETNRSRRSLDDSIISPLSKEEKINESQSILENSTKGNELNMTNTGNLWAVETKSNKKLGKG